MSGVTESPDIEIFYFELSLSFREHQDLKFFKKPWKSVNIC